MTPDRLLKTAIIPALAELEQHGIKDSPAARRFLLAIALQESGLKHRRQVALGGSEVGPASSFWQFEKAGGCTGVLTHRATKQTMAAVCSNFNVMPEPLALWMAMQYQDIVAACAARLLIFTLPDELPETAAAGWEQYQKAWRPGKPHPETWATNWKTADDFVKEFP